MSQIKDCRLSICPFISAAHSFVRNLNIFLFVKFHTSFKLTIHNKTSCFVKKKSDVKSVLLICHCLVIRSCLTLCDPWDWVPLSIGFLRQEYWSGLPFPFPGDLPDPQGANLRLLHWQTAYLLLSHHGSPTVKLLLFFCYFDNKIFLSSMNLFTLFLIFLKSILIEV